jgi:putative ABC transport system substrate-binding protein
MRRREFIAGLGSAAAWPLAAPGQQALPVIGFLHNEAPDQMASRVRAFHQGLSEVDYVVGRNVAIEYRWAEGQNDRLPALAADLVRSQVAVICTPGSTVSAIAAKAATRTIPIVFMVGTDPVQIGLVASLNRPEGNVTGVVSLSIETSAKRLELMHEMVPTAGLIGVLVNPANPPYSQAHLRELQAAAGILGVQLLILKASSDGEIANAFSSLARERAGALLITGDIYFTTHKDQIIALALRHAVATIEQDRTFAALGGLMSYGSSYQEAYRLVGNYVGRILKGEKPGDLPVQRATRVELAINLRTAKALGITFPTALLLRADEVIE